MLVKVLVIIYSLVFVLGVCVPVVIGRKAYNKSNYALKDTCVEIAEVFFKIFYKSLIAILIAFVIYIV
jgi:hypothetical protein